MLKNVLSTRELLSDNSDRNDSSLEASQQPFSQFDFSQINSQDLLSQSLNSSSQAQDGVQGKWGSLYDRWLGKGSEGKLYESRDSGQSMAHKRPQTDKGSLQQVPNLYLKAKNKDDRDFMQQTVTAVKDLTTETVKTLREIKEQLQEETAESLQSMKATLSSFAAGMGKHQTALIEIIQDRESWQQQTYETDMRVAQRDGEIKLLKEKLQGEQEMKKLLPAIQECKQRSETMAAVLQDYLDGAQSHRRQLEADVEAQTDFRTKCLATLNALEQTLLDSLEKRILDSVRKENRSVANEIMQACKLNTSGSDRALEETLWLRDHIQEEMQTMKQAFHESVGRIREDTFRQQQTLENKLEQVEISIKNQLQEQSSQMKESLRRIEASCAKRPAYSERETSTREAPQGNGTSPADNKPQHHPNLESYKPNGFRHPMAFRFSDDQHGSLTSRPTKQYPASVCSNFGLENRAGFRGNKRTLVWSRHPHREHRISYPGQKTWPDASCGNGKHDISNVMKESVVTSQSQKQTYLISPDSMSPVAIMYSHTQTQHKQLLSKRQNLGATKPQANPAEPATAWTSSVHPYHDQQRQDAQLSSITTKGGQRFLMRPPQQMGEKKMPFVWDDTESEGSSMLNPVCNTARKMQGAMPAKQFPSKPHYLQQPRFQREQSGERRLQELNEDDGDSLEDNNKARNGKNKEQRQGALSPTKSTTDQQSVTSWLEQTTNDNRQGMLQKSLQRIAQQCQRKQETMRRITRSSARKQMEDKGDQSPGGPPQKQRKRTSSFI